MAGETKSNENKLERGLMRMTVGLKLLVRGGVRVCFGLSVFWKNTLYKSKQLKL